MKRLSFLFVAFALFAFVSLNSCKTSTEPASEEVVEEVVEEVEEVVEEVVDTTPAEAEEAPVEEAAAE